EAAKARTQSNFKARKARIAEAHKASKKTALARIEDKEGRRKHKLQTETLHSERNRESALANNEATWTQFKAAIAEDEQGLAELETRAVKSFAGYPSFRRLLRRARESGAADLNCDEYQAQVEMR